MQLVLLGAPGSGKGTQARLLAKEYKLVQISTGDIFRETVKSATPLGQKIAQIIDSGELVSDELVKEVILKRLQKKDYQNGFILDGFPRTLLQAQHLEEILKQINIPSLNTVIYVEVSEKELIKRLSQRRVCSQCGHLYHLLYSPPKQEDRCNACGGSLYQRVDDREETIKKRLEVFYHNTAPLIEYYKNKGIFFPVEGGRTPQEIFGQIQEILNKFKT